MTLEDKPRSKVLLRSGAGRVRASGKTHVGPPIIDHGNGSASAPEVKLHRVNGVVEAIEVHCSCGEKILIRCDYE